MSAGKQYRGVFRRLAGIAVILLTIDMMATITLGTNARTTFTNVKNAIEQQQPQPLAEESNTAKAVLVLVIGVGLGAALFYWGDRASRLPPGPSSSE